MTTWREEVADMVDECVDAFKSDAVFTLARVVVGAFNTAAGTREKDDYSQTIELIEYRADQDLLAQYGRETVIYRGRTADLTESLGPEPQLAEGMYVTDAAGIGRRVVRVDREAMRGGFALVCVMDRSPGSD